MIGTLRWLARKFWLLVISLVIGLAILVQTGRILSPQVENYRPQISHWLSARLGVPVQMDGLSLRWQALEVALQLDGLRLGAQGQVKMGYGLFHLDLLASLWNRELVWKNLQVRDFSAELSRTADGGWHIEGFPAGDLPAPTHKPGGARRLGDPARIFQLGPKVQVRNASITLRLPDGPAAQVQLPQILLENSGGFHRLTGRAFLTRADQDAELDGGAETLRLVLEGRGNPRDKRHFSVDGYVQLNELLLDADIVSLLQQMLPLPQRYHWSGPKLARGKLWLQSDSQQGYRLRGRLNLARADSAAAVPGAGANKSAATKQGTAAKQNAAPQQAAVAKQPDAASKQAQIMAPLQSLSGEVSGHWQPGSQWQLALQNIQLGWRDLPMPPLNLQASSSAADGLQLTVDRVDVGAWGRILQRMALLKGPAAEWLQALQPSGALQRVQFSRDPGGQIVLRANLRDFSAAAYRGAPAVHALDGYLEVRGANGRVELDGGPGFSMQFPKLYPHAFTFERANGTVAWSVDKANNSVQIYSGPLQLDGKLGDINGQFLLQLPFHPHTRAADFTLSLGLRDAPLTAQQQLVPETVSDNLRDWLNRAVGAHNPGRVQRAAFIYRGSNYHEGDNPHLQALGEHPDRQTVQVAADIDNGSLDYAPGWPAARAVAARLRVDDRDVQVDAHSARLWQIDARNIEVAVTPSPVGQGSLLGVRAQLSGPAADGLRLLRDSPLRKQLGSAFDDWKLDGRMAGSLTLSQPLGGAEVAPRQSVQVQLQGGKLQLQNLRLAVDHLDGAVHFDSDSGLAGTSLTGDLWGRRLRAHIQHLGEGELRDTQVVIDGSSSIAAVKAWSARPELAWLDGDFDYRALVTIPARAKHKPYAAVFELSSDLAGVAVDLPAPFGKARDARTAYVLRAPIGEQGTLFHMNYGEHLQGQFWQVNGRVERAAIGLNAEAVLPDRRGLAVTGDLSQVDLHRWLERLQVFSDDTATDTTSTAATSGGTASDATSGSSGGDAHAADTAAAEPLPITLDLSTDRLQLGAADIDHIHVNGRGLGADWQLQFDSAMASGELSGVVNAETPLQLNLSHLQLPAPKAGETEPDDDKTEQGDDKAKADPWAGFDFTGLPRVDFSTDSLRIGEEDFGRWSFRMRPSAKRLVISDIRGAARGVRVEGRGEGEHKLGAQLMWLRNPDGSESTQFIGRLTAANLADVQRAWGQEPAIESERAGFDTALRWDGSPARVSADGLSGELKIDIRKGRFLRAKDTAGSALLRLLSLFNFDTWARRLRLDFSDLYQSGMAFDRVRGEVYFEGDGKLLIAVPIQVEGPTSELQMAGRVNLKREDLNLTLVATLPVGNNLALIAALAGGLPAAAGVYLISKAFKKQVNKMASVSYRISGDWAEPQVRFDKLFDDEGASREGNAAEAESRAPPAGSDPPGTVSGRQPEPRQLRESDSGGAQAPAI
ncbi:YhdP family protein [Microbulbifer sp. SAOS-129_SWC]|uniref:YhdP family protein n=1 Tax=Microbulbifer sp. SAOS-129_SWC TaxID=3145235 RepID=UPI003217A47B